MKKVLILALCLISICAFAQSKPTVALNSGGAVTIAPPPTPATTGGGWDISLGIVQPFLTGTTSGSTTINTSDLGFWGEFQYNLSDHWSIGADGWHDAAAITPYAPIKIPPATHHYWGADVISSYTLYSLDPKFSVDWPPWILNYLSVHAARVTLCTIGSLGVISMDGSITSSYMLGTRTTYWMGPNWNIKLDTGVRRCVLLGTPRTFFEARVLAGYRLGGK